MDKPLFTEVQKFRSKWLWFIILLAVLIDMTLFIYFFKDMLYPNEGRPVESLIFSVMTIMSIGVFLLLVILLFYYMRLIVKVYPDRIEYKYPPLIIRTKTIYGYEIYKFEIKTYRPLADYGGWGLRTKFRQKEKSVTVSGSQGIHFELKNGQKILLGTGKPEDFLRSIEHFKNAAGI